MKILEVKDLCKNYGKGSTLVKALDDVSFSVEEGVERLLLGMLMFLNKKMMLWQYLEEEK